MSEEIASHNFSSMTCSNNRVTSELLEETRHLEGLTVGRSIIPPDVRPWLSLESWIVIVISKRILCGAWWWFGGCQTHSDGYGGCDGTQLYGRTSNPSGPHPYPYSAVCRRPHGESLGDPGVSEHKHHQRCHGPLWDAPPQSRCTGISNIDLRAQRASSPDVGYSSPQRFCRRCDGWRAPCAMGHAIDPSAGASSVQRVRWR